MNLETTFSNVASTLYHHGPCVFQVLSCFPFLRIARACCASGWDLRGCNLYIYPFAVETKFNFKFTPDSSLS